MLLRTYNIELDSYEDTEIDDLVIDRADHSLPDISDRQFYQQLAAAGLVTESEALAAVSVGTLPAAVEAIVFSMSPGGQFAARMLLSGATSFARSHPLVEVFATAMGMTPHELDEFWRAAGAL